MTRRRAQACSGLIAFAVASCALLGMAHAAQKVALYMSETNDVLDLKWDKGPANLAAQLASLGFTVEPSLIGQPDLSSVGVYAIPVQNGGEYYSEVEDMAAVAEFVQRGGLVVLLDANTGNGEALTQFVNKAMQYEGDFTMCKQFATNARTPFGSPALSRHAKSLGNGVWPATLEDVQVTSVQSWCQHADRKAITTPLYTVFRDDMKTVAQVFAKEGCSGAVVWLGYSWKDGVQENWGEVLRNLIVDNGFHSASAVDADGNDPIESLIETVADSASVISSRRWMQGTYGSPSPAPAPGGVGVELYFNGADYTAITGNATTYDEFTGTVCNVTASATGAASCTIVNVTQGTAPSGRRLVQVQNTGTIVNLLLTPPPGVPLDVFANSVNNTLTNNATDIFPASFLAQFNISIVNAAVTIVGLSPSPAPSPSSPIPLIVISPAPVTASPTPASPAPTPSPAPGSAYATFFNLPAFGTVGTTRPLVWNYDADFMQQRKPRTAANLIFRNAARCPNRYNETCYACPRAFQNWDFNASRVVLAVPLYFPDAVQISAIQYLPIKNPSLVKIDLLAYPVPGLALGQPTPASKVTVYEAASDNSTCQEVRIFEVPDAVSHIYEPVPSREQLADKAYGGVILYFSRVGRKARSTYIRTVTFTGRAINPTVTYAKKKKL